MNAPILRRGPWQVALCDVGADVLCADLPYSHRTHAGYRSGGATAGSIGEQSGVIEYPAITREDAHVYADAWARRTKKWALIFGDHVSTAWHEEAWLAQGWYVFAPIAWIRRDAPPRFSGDGPQRSAERVTVARNVDDDDDPEVQWIMVARPRQITRVGSRPGWYLVNRVEGDVNGSEIPGQKNLAGMCALLRHYAKPGDTVVDTHAGTGTTLIAAQIVGCKSYGAEVKPEHFAIAERRIRKAQRRTPDMFATEAK